MDNNERKWLASVLLGLALVTLGLAMIVAKAGCAHTTSEGKPITGLVVNCGTKAVQDNWPTAYPKVMHCLTALVDAPLKCLDAIPAAISVSVDVVACIVQGAGQEGAQSARLNELDVVSTRKAERASAWIEYRGVQFVQ